MAEKSIKITIATALNAAGFTAAKRALSNLVSGTKNFAAKVGSNLMNIKAGFDMVSGVAMKLYGVFKDITQKAFNAEYLLTNFKTLTGSIDIARAHIADLKKFASETPLTIGDLSGASKTLLAYGASLDSIIPNLKMLGDISLGNSEKFASLVFAFGKVQSQGRMTALELKQMVLAGFNPLQEISKATGISMLDLRKDMENGAISFDLVRSAMVAATSEGGRFNNALLDASKTGNGLMSTLQDNWNMAISSFGAAFVEARKEGLEKMIDKLQELQRDGSIILWANKTKEAMDEVVDAAKMCGTAISAFWKWAGLSDAYRMVTGTVKAFGASGTRYIAGLANGESMREASRNSWAEGGNAYYEEQAKGHYSQMLAKKGWLGSGMKEAAEQLAEEERDAAEAAERAAKQAQSAASQAKSSATGTIKSMAEALAESKAAAVKKKLDEAVKEYGDKLKDVFGGSTDDVSDDFAVKPDFTAVRAAYAELAKARTADELEEAKKRIDAEIKLAKNAAAEINAAQKRKREDADAAKSFVDAYEEDQKKAAKDAARAELESRRDAMKKLHDERMKQIDEEERRVQKLIDDAKAKGYDNVMATAGGGYWGNGTLDQAGEARSEHQKAVDEARAAKAEESLRKKMERRGATLDDPSKLGRLSNLERAALERMRLNQNERKAEKLQKEREEREKQMVKDLDAINNRLKNVGL